MCISMVYAVIDTNVLVSACNRDIILTSTDPYGMNNALLGEQVDEAW